MGDCDGLLEDGKYINYNIYYNIFLFFWHNVICALVLGSTKTAQFFPSM